MYGEMAQHLYNVFQKNTMEIFVAICNELIEELYIDVYSNNVSQLFLKSSCVVSGFIPMFGFLKMDGNYFKGAQYGNEIGSAFGTIVFESGTDF